MMKVALALSTWRKVKAFQEGVRELAAVLPVSVARAYLVGGERIDGIVDVLYDRIDKLQELRKSGIAGEMRYVKAQISTSSSESPELVAAAAASLGYDDETAASLAALAQEGALTAEGLLGNYILSGDDIRFGFAPSVLELAPSLIVYEHFMWFDESELG